MEVDCIDGGENVVEALVVKEDIEDSVIDEDWLDCGVSRSAVFGVKPFEFVLCHNAWFLITLSILQTLCQNFFGDGCLASIFVDFTHLVFFGHPLVPLFGPKHEGEISLLFIILEVPFVQVVAHHTPRAFNTIIGAFFQYFRFHNAYF